VQTGDEVVRTVYFDCFSGVSGDMVLGALLDLGLPLDGLRAALGSLTIDAGAIAAERVLRAGVSATRFKAAAAEQEEAAHEHHHEHAHVHGGAPEPASHRHLHARGHPHHHSLAEIEGLIARSALPPAGKARAAHLFERLAEAEAAIHQVPLAQVHLHEVGALDSIIDIVGAVHGMEWLGADEIVASPLNVGSGTVRCAHGVYPVPAPATTRLLRGVPVYAGAVASELVTPTGALIVTEYARSYGPLPPMRLEAVGYGAGSRDIEGRPNVLRVLVGESLEGRPTEPLVVLECEIDDMNPQLFGPLMDRLFEAGALDVFYAPVHMKKNRPGTLVTAIAPPDRREALAGVLFADTTTIGVRYQEVRRERLDRESVALETPVGLIRFKVARRDGRVRNAAPEFDDCARIAAERGMAIKDVLAIASKAWLEARQQQGDRD
jgi:uncharacterized protein (TIGR00299 family) protein